MLLNGCRIGTGSIVAAGALVPEGMVVPPGSMVMGMPAKVKRPLTERRTRRSSGMRTTTYGTGSIQHLTTQCPMRNAQCPMPNGLTGHH